MLADTATPAVTAAPENDAVYVSAVTLHDTGTGAHPETAIGSVRANETVPGSPSA